MVSSALITRIFFIWGPFLIKWFSCRDTEWKSDYKTNFSHHSKKTTTKSQNLSLSKQLPHRWGEKRRLCVPFPDIAPRQHRG
jgi:hypothetical protein